MKDYIKDFKNWIKIKSDIDNQENRQYVRHGEIRWASMGVNVGSEIDGKGPSFTRSVLIISVMGSHLAMVVPLSSKNKNHLGYIPFVYKNKKDYACVHQVRVISQKRIFSRISKVSGNKLQYIKDKIKEFFEL